MVGSACVLLHDGQSIKGVRAGGPSVGTFRHLSSFTLYAAIRAPHLQHITSVA